MFESKEDEEKWTNLMLFKMPITNEQVENLSSWPMVICIAIMLTIIFLAALS